MNIFQAIILAIVEGLTEFLPISSTAHMGFVASLMHIPESDFLKMFQVSIQFGAILAVVWEYRKKFFNVNKLNFYIKLAIAVIPALVLGKLFNDKIEAILENQKTIATVLVLGGVVLLFVDKWFKTQTLDNEKDISWQKGLIIGFWQCLAMMPGTSRSAASIVGGMTQGLTRKAAAEFSFFLAVPTMMAVTVYSVFLKTWGQNTPHATKGYQILMASSENLTLFLLGNIVAFITALIAIKSFINLLNKYGFKFWGVYRIVIGLVLLAYFFATGSTI